MTTIDDTATKPRRRSGPEIDTRPIMVSHQRAAAMLAEISERTLDQLVAEGRLTPRQITKGRVGYLMREIEAFADDLPKVKPGQPKPQAGHPAE